jgi:radical SAM-linked protein
MAQRRPDREAVPPVQRLRLRYTKTGRMRFTSHRDFQRALERAVRRAQVPMAYSAGFSPHPRISYANAAPTGAASLAEYVEIAVVSRCDPDALRREVDAALPVGLDIAEVVIARTPDLVARLEASVWTIEFPGTDLEQVAGAWQVMEDAQEVLVERMTKSGPRTFDVRSAVIAATPRQGRTGAELEVTLRHQVPTVRPDDVVAALASLTGFASSVPPVLTRLRQGPLGPNDQIGDPLEPDRRMAGE